MKYIMLKVDLPEIAKLVPIIFPDFMVHEDVAAVIGVVLEDRHKLTATVHSAGDITFEYPMCSGRSETLGLDASNSDSAIISTYDYFGGLVG